MNSSPLTSLGPTSAPAMPSSQATLLAQGELDCDTLPPSSSPSRSGTAPKPSNDAQPPVVGSSSLASLNPPPKPQPKSSRTYSRAGAKRVSEPLPPVFVPRERHFDERDEDKASSDESEEENAVSSPVKGKGKGKAKAHGPTSSAAGGESSDEADEPAPPPIKKSTGILSDDDDDDDDPEAAERVMEELRRQARGTLPASTAAAATASSSTSSPPTNDQTTANSTAPDQDLIPKPRPATAIPSGLNPLAPTSSMTTLAPTSNDDAALASAHSAVAEGESDEEMFPVGRTSFHASKGRRQVATSSAGEEDEQDTPAKPSRTLQRGPARPPTPPEDVDEETMPTVAEAGAELVAATARRKSIPSTAFPTFPPSEQDIDRLGRPSSEDIAEFESSPSLKKQYLDALGKADAPIAEASAGGKKLKPLTKKEQAEMKKTMAKMNREQQVSLARAEAPKRTMADLLSRVQGTRTQGKNKEKPVSGWADRVDLHNPRPSSSKPTSASESTPTVLSKALPVPRSRSPPRSATVKANVLVPSDLSDSDRDEDMPEVDDLFEAGRRAAEEQKKRDKVAQIKARALAAASVTKQPVASGSKDLVLGSDDSDLEIERPAPKVASKPPSSRRSDLTSAVAASPRQSDFQRKQLKLHGRPSAPSLAHPNHDASESQLINAGKTFGHALKRQGPVPGKPQYAAKIDQEALNNNLLANAAARARKERAEKEAKYGTGRALAAREQVDLLAMADRLRVEEEEKRSRNEQDDMDEDDGEDDPDDGDFAPEGEQAMDEDATQTAGEEDEDEMEETQVDPEAAEMDEDDSSFGSDKENARPTGMVDANSTRPPLVSRVSLPLGNRDLSVPPDSEASEGSEDEDEDDEATLALKHKSRRPRATLRVNDEEDEQENEQPVRSPAKLVFGGELPGQQPFGQSTSSGLGLGLGAAFGDDEGSAGGFGEGGFSQLFVPTQQGTVAGSGSIAGAASGGFDFGGGDEGGGFSQLFEATQATETSDVQGGGGLQGLRAPERQMLVPQASLLPSVRVSESQARRDAEVVALHNPGEAEVASTQAPAQYINAQGFFTQTKPANYNDSFDAPTPNPIRTGLVARETPGGGTETIYEEDESPAPARAAAFPLSSPTMSKNPNRRLLARRELAAESSMTTASEIESPSTTTLAQTSPTASIVAQSSSPTKQPTAIVPTAPIVPKVKKPRVPTTMAFMDGEASESDDEEAGFGGFGRTGARDDGEDEEDMDKPVEGLVNDEEVAEDKLRRDNEERQQFLREQEIADEAARLKAAQDIADGEHRKKKKDGTGMDFDDSEEEEAYRKGNSLQRKERNQKRKLDKLDPMDRIAVESKPFFEAYVDTYEPDLNGYDKLLSDHEDEGNSSQEEYRQRLGIKGGRSSRTSVQPKTRRRVVDSPEPLEDGSQPQLESQYSEMPSQSQSSPPRPSRNKPKSDTLNTIATLVDSDADMASDSDAADDEEDDDLEPLSESQHLVRRGAARPQPRPVQKDEYDVSAAYSRGASSSSSSSVGMNKRARLEQYSKDESQNSIGTSRGGSAASVNGMKKSGSVSRDGKTVQLAAKTSGLGEGARRTSGLVASRSGKWE